MKNNLSCGWWQKKHLIFVCLDWKVFSSRPGETKVSRGWRRAFAFTWRVCLCQRVSAFFLNRCLGLLVSSSHCYNTLIWPTGTMPAQRLTWGPLHWSACLPTCRLLTCSKQVEFHFDSLELVFSDSHLNAYSRAHWKRMACTFKLNSLFLLWWQCQSLAWTPLCFCVWRSDRKTSWLNLKQMIRGAFFPPVSLHLLLFKPTGWQCCLLTFNT